MNELATINGTGRPATLQRGRELVNTLEDVFRLADVLVRSGMLPRDIRTPEAAAAIMLKGRELGIGAMEAFSGITVIQGKPTVSPQLMLSLINRSGLLADMGIEDDGSACTVTMTRRGRKPHREAFSMQDAKGMQLAGKDNWTKQPKIMRKWRAVAACARIVFPDVIAGMYLHDEMGADVDADGEIVTVEADDVHEEAPQPQYVKHAQPEGGDPRTDKAFRDWCESYAGKVNERWRGLLDEIGEPSEGAELLREFRLSGHLHKWALAEGLYPDRDNGEWNYQHRLRALGIAFRDHQAHVKAEAKAYVEHLKEEAEAKLQGPPAEDRRDPAPIGDDDGDPPAPWDDPDQGQDADS